MSLLFAFALILTFAGIYFFVIEVFSVAFKLTGLASKKVRFQVASIFTATGFTTQESELIVNDERRRKIAIVCMYTSHIFSVIIMGLLINLILSLVTVIASNPTITAKTFTEWYAIVFYISFTFFIGVMIIRIPPVHKRFINFLEKAAIKLSRNNRKTNIITVIDMYGKNAVVEVLLNKIPEFAKDKTLFEMQLTKKYLINILTIRRNNRTLEVTKDTMFNQGDVIVIFGLVNDIKNAFVNSLDKGTDTIIVNENANILNLLNNYGPNVLMEIDVEEVPQEIEGLPMKDSHLPDRYSINVVVIRRNDDYITVDKDTIIQKGDRITVLGPHKNIKHLFQND